MKPDILVDTPDNN